MKSLTSSKFWQCYRKLPAQIQKAANDSYRLFRVDPEHRSLHFKRVSRNQPVYSARVNDDYRTLGVRQAVAIVWFWIGSHDEYERKLKTL